MQNFKRMSGVVAMLVALGLWVATPAHAAENMGGGMQTMEKQHNAGKKQKKAKKAKKKAKKKAATAVQ